MQFKSVLKGVKKDLILAFPLREWGVCAELIFALKHATQHYRETWNLPDSTMRPFLSRNW